MNNEKTEDSKKQEAKKEERKNKFKRICLGFYLMALTSALVWFLFCKWPTDSASIDDRTILLLVILIGALGSSVHATTSFVTYVGNRSIVKSWYWWYILRPFIGMALALIFYFVIRGGFLSTDANSEAINLFGIAAVSGLVGLFSKHATDKLRELFDNLFKTDKGDELRKDKLNENLPVDERMLPLENITFALLPDPKDDDIPEKQISIKKLTEMLKGMVTRIPILDSKDIVKYVIHQSLLYKFIAQKTIESDDKIDLEKLFLEDFLNFNKNRNMVSETLAFVPKESTIGAAKEKMEATENCQDIFVTEHGTREEPILGWLTNIEISRHIITP